MWNQNHAALLQAYVNRFGLPPLDNELARGWTLKLAEQFAFSFPGEGWGTKRADPGRPQSTDVIAIQSPFTGFDVVLSQGASHQSIIMHPEPISLAGQVFMPVTPRNHLAGAPVPVPVEPPVVPPAPVDVTALLDAISALRAQVEAQTAQLQTLASMVSAAHVAALQAKQAAESIRVGKAPDYVGKLWGQTITFTPKP